MDTFTMTIGGDVMLGRLVDQIQSIHTKNDSDDECLNFQTLNLGPIPHSYPFGNLHHYFSSSDLNIINLETTITQSDFKWPNKAFNFRMHPANARILSLANIHYCSLANNHILDYGMKGMSDTIRALDLLDILHAGAGIHANEAKYKDVNGIQLAFLSSSDHPKEWSCFKEFSFVDSQNPNVHSLIERIHKAKQRSDFLVFSIHWGGNYEWYVSPEMRRLARFLIDQGVDLIHGHSSHHIKGIEIYKGKPIFYGCGDLLDDYAMSRHYRNDLGFLYRLEFQKNVVKSSNFFIKTMTQSPPSLYKIVLIPTKISKMQVNVTKDPKDIEWLQQTMTRLCFDLNTIVDTSSSPFMTIQGFPMNEKEG